MYFGVHSTIILPDLIPSVMEIVLNSFCFGFMPKNIGVEVANLDQLVGASANSSAGTKTAPRHLQILLLQLNICCFAVKLLQKDLLSQYTQTNYLTVTFIITPVAPIIISTSVPQRTRWITFIHIIQRSVKQSGEVFCETRHFCSLRKQT